jgi:hypothetical protein
MSQTTIIPGLAALNCKKLPFMPKNDDSTLSSNGLLGAASASIHSIS